MLPGGDQLTLRMFRQLGWMLGMSDGAEHLHYIIELPEDSPGVPTRPRGWPSAVFSQSALRSRPRGLLL